MTDRRSTTADRPAAGYILTSTDSHPDAGNWQQRVIEALAEDLQLDDVEWYRDHLQTPSADLQRRPAFRRLLADVQAGRFGTVLCEASRQISGEYSAEVALAIATFRVAGVQLFTGVGGWVPWHVFRAGLTIPLDFRTKPALLPRRLTLSCKPQSLFWFTGPGPLLLDDDC